MPATTRSVTKTAAPSHLTFTENVTPRSYVQDRDSADQLQSLDLEQLNELRSSMESTPQGSASQPAKKRRRGPAHRRVSQGHIPRPPNAFMLFRQYYVKQHRPGTTFTDGQQEQSLSKAIGQVWHDLSASEKAEWTKKALVEKEIHKKKFPDYVYKPIHKKRKRVDGASDDKPKPKAPKRRHTSDEFSRRRSLTFATLDFEKQRDYQIRRNKYLTKQLKLGYKHEELAPMMKKYDEYYIPRYEQGLESISPIGSDDGFFDDDTEFHSDSATLLDHEEAVWGPRLKLDVPSPSVSCMSSPATNLYSLSSSPAPSGIASQEAPFTLPTVPNMHLLAPPEESSSSSGWGFQHLRRSSSVPPLYIPWDSASGPSSYDFNMGEASMASASTPLTPVESLSHSNFLPTDMELDYGQMSVEHRSLIGGRRASSAGGTRRSWGTLNKLAAGASGYSQDWAMAGASNDADQWSQWGWMPTEAGVVGEELPEVEGGLFQPNFDLSQAASSPKTEADISESLSPLESPIPTTVAPHSLLYGPGQIPIMAPQPVSPVPVQQFDPAVASFHPTPAAHELIMDSEFHCGPGDALVYPPEVVDQ
ncbi:hypothetical protein V5O48_007380 [Marasmius crinis-equi]|uniref:HMG box domain-containing protein n=1 Tax=Marasmius crinis-equi TaxID=585013 RepID=A0ABR3FGT3_9AGAR